MQVRIAGASLARIFRRAVSHLILAPGESAPAAELTIDLAESGDAAALAALRAVAERLPRRWASPDLEIRSSECGRVVSFAAGQRSLFVLDREERTLTGVQDPAALLLFERTKPLLLPLRVWLQDHGIYLLHAGLVSSGEDGVLIGGPERVGKSSTALRCLAAGFDFLGDDQTAAAASDAEMSGYSLHGAAQVQPDWLGELGSFPAGALDRDESEDKVGLFLGEVAPQRLRRTVPIRAVVLPRLEAGRAVGVERATKAEALLRLAPSTLFQPFGAGADGVDVLRRLVERLPAYWLDPGEDASSIAVSVRQVLHQARAR